MPDILAQAVQQPAFLGLLVLVLFGGLSFGFAGFGIALIFMPVGAAVLGPSVAVAVVNVITLCAVFTILPPAWAIANKRQVLWLVIPAFIAVAPGFWLLRVLDPMLIRWMLSVLVAACLIALVRGWTRPLNPSRIALASVGAGAGLMGGMTGLIGPLVILFNLAGREEIRRTRANILCFLILLSVMSLPQLALQGLLDAQVWWYSAAFAPFFLAGLLIGRWLFDPRYEALVRGMGYAVVGGSVLVGSPVWG